MIGCGTMMRFMGDNIVHSLSGTVRSTVTEDGIPSVKVALKCSGLEKSLYQNAKVITDEKGNYKIVGYWPLDNCTLSFNHRDFQSATININENHLIRREGLTLTYKINQILSPTIKMQ